MKDYEIDFLIKNALVNDQSLQRDDLATHYNEMFEEMLSAADFAPAAPIALRTKSRRKKFMIGGMISLVALTAGGVAAANNLLGDFSQRLVDNSECDLNPGDAKLVAALDVDADHRWEYWEILSSKGSGNLVKLIGPSGKETQYGLSCINSSWRNPNPEANVMGIPAPDGTVDVLVYGTSMKNADTVEITLRNGFSMKIPQTAGGHFIHYANTGSSSWNVELQSFVVRGSGRMLFGKGY
jgi:hypothetical protein